MGHILHSCSLLTEWPGLGEQNHTGIEGVYEKDRTLGIVNIILQWKEEPIFINELLCVIHDEVPCVFINVYNHSAKLLSLFLFYRWRNATWWLSDSCESQKNPFFPVPIILGLPSVDFLYLLALPWPFEEVMFLVLFPLGSIRKCI